jgi:hypothetical protein
MIREYAVDGDSRIAPTGASDIAGFDSQPRAYALGYYLPALWA